MKFFEFTRSHYLPFGGLWSVGLCNDGPKPYYGA